MVTAGLMGQRAILYVVSCYNTMSQAPDVMAVCDSATNTKCERNWEI